MVALGFLVLQCNPNPSLVWRKTPLWVGCISARHLGPVAPAFGMQFGKEEADVEEMLVLLSSPAWLSTGHCPAVTLLKT